jgi:iron complex outermembrane receptor protein
MTSRILQLAGWLALGGLMVSRGAFPADEPALPQAGGTIRGTVTIAANGLALHKARVVITELGLTTETDEEGVYQFLSVPEGTYRLVASSPGLSDARQTIRVRAGGTAQADFALALAMAHEQVTVTASGKEQAKIETFQSVVSLDSVDLVENSKGSLGEVLEGEPGVAKRSFGPGTSRPVIRGFDGDRVLIMKDGMSSGSLSSQSGDHGESFSTLNLERLEVVKGPATLLYGSNAVGGVVNAITPHSVLHDHVHPGPSGYFTALGGSANASGGTGGGLEYGVGNWLFWGDGAAQRTGDYSSAAGKVPNSFMRLTNGGGGFGHYTQRTFFTFTGGRDSSTYGIPPAGGERVHLATHRTSGRWTAGFRQLNSFVQGVRLTFDYGRYHHEELSELGVPDTIFDNHLFAYRGVLEQRKQGPLTGSFGFSGLHRIYRTSGEEAIAPPVDQTNLAFFTLQELGFKRFKVQFGGRFDQTSYDPPIPPSPMARARVFTGLSGAAGVNVPLWEGAAFVANYSHSFRSPALEELYNHGPHPGNATFEIGNSNLRRERSNGIDLAFRQQEGRLHGELDFFYYDIDHFVFLAPTGNVNDGLIEAEYLQAGSRFTGAEANVHAELCQYLWIVAGLDYVDAQLTGSVASQTTGLVTPLGTPLPRIPPLRGRAGFDLRYKQFNLRPEAIMARSQENIFPTETRTPGYTTFDLRASYTVVRQHAAHVFSLSAFNLGNRLYFNHLSFIKDFAPEIGRGVRVAYTVRFY